MGPPVPLAGQRYGTALPICQRSVSVRQSIPPTNTGILMTSKGGTPAERTEATINARRLNHVCDALSVGVDVLRLRARSGDGVRPRLLHAGGVLLLVGTC